MRFLAVALLLVSSSVSATELSANVLAQLVLQCRQISDADARLHCYDQLKVVQTGSAQPQSVSATAAQLQPPTQPAIASQPAVHAENEFGKRLPSAADDLTSISSSIEQVRFTAPNRAIIQLANGQRWQQVESMEMNLTTGKVCTVKRAALGSFLFRCEGSNKSMRVKRLE